jgi:hypothetical protein
MQIEVLADAEAVAKRGAAIVAAAAREGLIGSRHLFGVHILTADRLAYSADVTIAS